VETVEYKFVTKVEHYSESGFDPIITATPEKPDSQLQFNRRIRGPIGHTFDRTLDAALFTATSFIIPAPQPKTGERDFSWGFCKLRFRRTIKVNKTTTLRSEFAEPLWVQYLPEFFLADISGAQFANLRLRALDESVNKLSVVDGPSGRTATLESQKTDPTAKAVFDLYLVLTRRVFDATGRHDEEEYIGLFYRDNNDWVRAGSRGTPPEVKSSDPLLARVIEVQRRSIGTSVFKSEDDLWDALFDRSGAKISSDSSRARIVRISEPIPNPAAVTRVC